MDKNNEIRFIFCYISKAFDRVWHDGLIFKLESYGISGNVLNWFKNYLSDRKQRVLTKGFHSTFKHVKAGVPQGSVLGPFLFLIYINDIADCITSNFKLFADDTSIFEVVEINSGEIAQKLTYDLSNLNIWANRWDIKFNPQKTESMLFSRKREQTNPDILFAGDTVSSVKIHKHLGLTFSSDGKWSHHIINIYNKAYKRINILRMLKYKVDRKSLTTIYTSFIRPILEYGDVIWDNCTNQEKDLLESVQLEALRIITGLRRGTSHYKLYAETGIETLSSRRSQHKLILMYKILRNETPNYLSNIIEPFIYINENVRYPLRNTRLFNIPVCRTESYRNSYFPSTLREFNMLQLDLVNSNSLQQFKKRIKPNVNNQTGANNSFKYIGPRKYNTLLCQLRNNASNLNSDLFNDHLLDSSVCRCRYENENAQHYLFECPLYTVSRNRLIENIAQIGTYLDHDHLNLETLLYGCMICNANTNLALLNSVFEYLQQTNRFNV